MPRTWSAKRERQYEHLKEGLVEQGRSEDTAELERQLARKRSGCQYSRLITK